jgi:hypothetical protein
VHGAVQLHHAVERIRAPQLHLWGQQSHKGIVVTPHWSALGGKQLR